MIVLDASVVLEALLRMPAGVALDERLFEAEASGTYAATCPRTTRCISRLQRRSMRPYSPATGAWRTRRRTVRASNSSNPLD